MDYIVILWSNSESDTRKPWPLSNYSTLFHDNQPNRYGSSSSKVRQCTLLIQIYWDVTFGQQAIIEIYSF